MTTENGSPPAFETRTTRPARSQPGERVSPLFTFSIAPRDWNDVIWAGALFSVFAVLAGTAITLIVIGAISLFSA